MLDLSILITRYKRPDALKQCVSAIRTVKWPGSYEIVVSDDGSGPEILSEIEKIPDIIVLQTATNRGIGANLNTGILSCRGKFILYCKEDFLLKPAVPEVLPECFELLENKTVDMVRLTANYRFKKLIPVSEHISMIPKFSWTNFKYNAFQYSDNPFITTLDFYKKFGAYLEGVWGDYGEVEFAIRVFKSDAKIGITKKYYVTNAANSQSVMQRPVNTKERKLIKIGGKQLHSFIRALRLHLEYFLYHKNKRKLYTYRNSAMK